MVAVPRPLGRHLVWLSFVVGTSVVAQSASPGPSRIYSCLDKSGRRLSSDRPIPECANQEQKLLNRDGSVRGVARPLASLEELAQQEQARQQQAQLQALQEEAARRDRNLLRRYPNEAAYEQARGRAMEPVSRQIGESRARLDALQREAQALAQQLKAEKSKSVSEAMRQRMASNAAALDAQNSILKDREMERERMHQHFEDELVVLRALWSGAAPGTVSAAASGVAK